MYEPDAMVHLMTLEQLVIDRVLNLTALKQFEVQTLFLSVIIIYDNMTIIINRIMPCDHLKIYRVLSVTLWLNLSVMTLRHCKQFVCPVIRTRQCLGINSWRIPTTVLMLIGWPVTRATNACNRRSSNQLDFTLI
jgi:hypothetical protein